MSFVESITNIQLKLKKINKSAYELKIQFVNVIESKNNLFDYVNICCVIDKNNNVVLKCFY